MAGREDNAPVHCCGAFAVDPGDGDCADAVATSPFSAQIKASMLMKRSSVRMLSALFDGRGNGDAKLGGAFEGIAVNPFDGIRRKNSGDAAIKRCTHGINVCPGSLISMGRVLLLRGIAML